MPVDNAVRGVRVLSRQALGLTEDRDKVSDEQVELLDELSEIMLAVSELYSQGKSMGTTRRLKFRTLCSACASWAGAPGWTLSIKKARCRPI